MIDSFFHYTKTEPLISGWKCTLIVEGRQVFCGFKDISNLFYYGSCDNILTRFFLTLRGQIIVNL